MNERIKQLWEQAAKTTQGDSWEEQTKFMEKFAELIVRECARVGGDIVLNQNEDNDMGVFLGIKHHFGVEE